MTALRRAHRRPRAALPAGAADCHLHVLGPYARFPLARERAYTVPEAPLEAHERMKRTVGLERTVLVQASGHGTDNGAMLEALEALGPRGRGVAVVEPDAAPEDLLRLHEGGVRGVRLNLVTLGTRYPGERAVHLARYAKLVAPLGWHLQIFAAASDLVALEAAIGGSPMPVVIDHMGLPDASLGTSHADFQAVLRLARCPHVWVKLSGADRITRSTGRLADALPFMRALVAAAPERVVWGSDWPNIGFHAGRQVADDAILPHRELDAGELLDLLEEAVPERAVREAILAGNPAVLYR